MFTDNSFKKIPISYSFRPSHFLLLFIGLTFYQTSYSQYEVKMSYSGTQVSDVLGFGVNLGYELPFNNERLGLKPQVAYKCNCSYLDLTSTDFKNRRYELHTTGYYKLIDNPNYQLIPNLGLNLIYSKWTAQMRPPFGTLPNRFYYIEMNGEVLTVSSTEGADYDELEVFQPGFSLQIQNRFQISNKVSLTVSPFIELNHERSQSNGGGYLGIYYKK